MDSCFPRFPNRELFLTPENIEFHRLLSRPPKSISATDGWSLETRQYEWSSITFVDGQALTFSAGGKLLYGDRNKLEEELVYVIQRTPEGRQETLTASEFEELIEQTAESP